MGVGAPRELLGYDAKTKQRSRLPAPRPPRTFTEPLGDAPAARGSRETLPGESESEALRVRRAEPEGQARCRDGPRIAEASAPGGAAGRPKRESSWRNRPQSGRRPPALARRTGNAGTRHRTDKLRAPRTPAQGTGPAGARPTGGPPVGILAVPTSGPGAPASPAGTLRDCRTPARKGSNRQAGTPRGSGSHRRLTRGFSRAG